MRTKLLAVLPLLALATATVASVPSAHATTAIYHLNIKYHASLFDYTATATIPIVDSTGTGVVHVHVGNNILSVIQHGFGTTSFDFPDSYTGNYTIYGIAISLTVQSNDAFTLVYT
jgi:hypothetical protein